MNTTGGRPEISVVVTAYNRRDYARDALESVLAQSFPKNGYELVLAKNFVDAALDSYAGLNDVRTLLCRRESIGDMVLDAVDDSRGELVLLLDDDDVYLQGKLARVSQVMSDPSIGYYHNNAKLFGPSAGSTGSILKQPRTGTTITPESSPSAVLKAIDEGATFNSSCVAFRKDVLFANREMVRGIPTGPAFSLFMASLLSGKRNFIDPEPLTGYRTRAPRSKDAALREKTASIARAAETVRTAALHELSGPLAVVNDYKASELCLRLYLLGAVGQHARARSCALALIAAHTLHKPIYRASLFLFVLFWPIVPKQPRSWVRGLPSI